MEIFENSSLNQGKCLETKPQLFLHSLMSAEKQRPSNLNLQSWAESEERHSWLMSHLVYASQGTSTLRPATSIVTDAGNNKQNALQMVLSSMEWQGVNSNIANTFPKFKAECDCSNFPLTSAQPFLPGPRDLDSSRLGIMQTSCSSCFSKWRGVFCCHWEAKFSNVQKVHRYNTKTKFSKKKKKQLLTLLYLCSLTFSPYQYIKQIIWFYYRWTWFPYGTKRRTEFC